MQQEIKKKPIVTITAIILATATIIGLVVTLSPKPTPVVTYETIGPYKIPGVSNEYLLTIILRNQGSIKATDVRMTVDITPATIISFDYKSDEEVLLENKNNTAKMVLTSKRLGAGKDVTTWLRASSSSSQISTTVTVTVEDGSVMSITKYIESQVSSYNNTLLLEIILLVILAGVDGALVLSLIRAVKRKYRSESIHE